MVIGVVANGDCLLLMPSIGRVRQQVLLNHRRGTDQASTLTPVGLKGQWCSRKGCRRLQLGAAGRLQLGQERFTVLTEPKALFALALRIAAEHSPWIHRPVVAVQRPIQHQLLTWKTAVTQELRQGETIGATLKTALEGLDRLIRWIPGALPLSMDHPGG